MFATIKRMMYEQIREEGRKEGLKEIQRQVDAEWQDWLDRRTATGVFMFNCYDPPPSRSITGRVGSGHSSAPGKLR